MWQVAWSPGAPGLLATTGEDGFVLLWDCNKLQQPPDGQVSGLQAGAGRRKKQQPRQRKQQQQQQTPLLTDHLYPAEPHDSKVLQEMRQLVQPGLQFVHHGHLSRVEAAAWNPDKPWVIASASQAALAENKAGHEEEVQGNLVMVWEVNRSVGLIW
jgi:WD40 repeat protein